MQRNFKIKLRGRAAQAFRRIGALAKPALAILVFAVAVWVVRNQIAGIRWRDVEAAILAISPLRIAATAACTACSYACLGIVEYYAFRYGGRSLNLRRTVLTSLPANAIANGLGFGLVTGTAIRLRLYRRARLSMRQATMLVVRISASAFLSGTTIVGLALLLDLGRFAAAMKSLYAALAIALLLTSPAAAWFLAARRRVPGKAPLRALERPAALAAALGDWLFSAAGLYVLSSHPAGQFPQFLAVFAAGSVVGSIVGIPGAIGPLDAAILGTVAASGHLHESAAALLVYRLIFLIAPLAVALAGVGVAQALRTAFRRR